uniref:EOG090X0BEK n=1 Tax=Daphnia magna TaxID=35525 RepID=A0A4Y7ME96_9CRUS|nr:EOG090X0BEK [Daphnia magna]
MAIVVSYGLCSAFGVFYGPVHSILPFLLLGIGIDDMFVIVQCWSNLNKEEMKRRIESHRDGMIPCFVHRNWKPSSLSRIEPLQLFFNRFLAKYLFKWPAKVFILVLAAFLLGINTWGSVLMRQEFNPLWFIPTSTYLSQYFSVIESHFPDNGQMASIYIQTTNLSSNLDRLDALIDTVRNETNIVSQVDDWFGGFKEFTAKRHAIDWMNQNMTDEQFSTYLKNYLFTQKGAKFRRNFKFEDPLQCRSAIAPPLSITNFDFVFRPFSGREEHIPAMRRIKDIADNFSQQFGSQVFASARIFSSWETDEVIMEELYRNLAIAMVCVFITTFILIANLFACVLVLLCVVLTLVCVNGTMHFWGLTIDTVSCINLVLAIGLSQQVRGMATLKMISIRLKSVKNIQKITQSMKMVSAAKYTKAERELKLARPYGIGAQEFYKKAEVKDEEGEKGQLIIAVSSDRGLCGAVHSSIGRIVKTDIAANPNTKVVIVGDKVRNILQRLYAKNIAMVVTEVGRKPAVFGDAALVAQSIINSGIEFSKGKILFNAFRTVVSFRTTEMPLYSQNAVANASKLPVYDSLDSDVIQSYTEFSLASLLFYSMKENATSEQSSRMTAMDNASKNAGEMIDKLTMTFNRTRQAVITRELIEIISGAAALETKN